MLTLSDDMFTLSIFIALTAAIYSIIMVVFVIARRKYKGGIVDKAIRYIIATIGLFLLADIALIVLPTFGIQWGYILHILLKILAMTCLAKGGLELFARQT
jgi:hypothetical protein